MSTLKAESNILCVLTPVWYYYAPALRAGGIK